VKLKTDVADNNDTFHNTQSVTLLQTDSKNGLLLTMWHLSTQQYGVHQ